MTTSNSLLQHVSDLKIHQATIIKTIKITQDTLACRTLNNVMFCNKINYKINTAYCRHFFSHMIIKMQVVTTKSSCNYFETFLLTAKSVNGNSSTTYINLYFKLIALSFKFIPNTTYILSFFVLIVDSCCIGNRITSFDFILI